MSYSGGYASIPRYRLAIRQIHSGSSLITLVRNSHYCLVLQEITACKASRNSLQYHQNSSMAPRLTWCSLTPLETLSFQTCKQAHHEVHSGETIRRALEGHDQLLMCRSTVNVPRVAHIRSATSVCRNPAAQSPPRTPVPQSAAEEGCALGAA